MATTRAALRAPSILNRDNRGVGLHNNEPLIDVFDAQTGQAVSIKTLDWNTTAKIKPPALVVANIRGQVNPLAPFASNCSALLRVAIWMRAA